MKKRSQNLQVVTDSIRVKYVFKSSYLASHSQGDINRYGLHAGNQCVANSLVALIALPKSTSYSSNEIDMILRDGDNLYRFLKSLPTSNKEDPYLEFNELPNSIKLRGVTYTVELIDRFYAAYDEDMNSKRRSSAVYIPLQEALHKALNKSSTILSMIGEFAISFYFTGGYYYVFDPHGRNFKGEQVASNGKAVVMQFADFNNALNYIKYLRGVCANSSHPTIQLRPVKITGESGNSNPTADNDKNFFESYLKDQEQKRRCKFQDKKSYAEVAAATCGPSTSSTNPAKKISTNPLFSNTYDSTSPEQL